MFDEYTEGEGEIICPYCGENNITSETDAEFVFVCEKCGKSMYVHTVYFGFKSCDLNGEEHDFVKRTPDSEYYHCTKCGEIKKDKEVKK